VVLSTSVLTISGPDAVTLTGGAVNLPPPLTSLIDQIETTFQRLPPVFEGGGLDGVGLIADVDRQWREIGYTGSIVFTREGHYMIEISTATLNFRPYLTHWNWIRHCPTPMSVNAGSSNGGQ